MKTLLSRPFSRLANITVPLLLATVIPVPPAFGGDGNLGEYAETISRQLTSISYEMISTYTNSEGSQKSFVFRFWSKGPKWRAERSDIKDGKELPSYAQSFDGERYQVLHYAEDRIQVSSEIFPKGPVFPSALYDNAPFQALGFLSFNDATVLPSNLRALSPSQAFDPETWKPFLAHAKKLNGGEAAKVAKYSLTNAAPDALHATEVQVEFSDQSAFFPRRISKTRTQQGLRSVDFEISEYRTTPIPGFSFPSAMQFKWYSPKEGNALLYTAEAKLTSLSVNEPIPDDKFTIDLNLAAEVWDADNRITLPTRATP